VCRGYATVYERENVKYDIFRKVDIKLTISNKNIYDPS
jgi:hypothetical protein